METLTKKEVSILHAASVRGMIDISDSFLDKMYRLTKNAYSDNDQILVNRCLQAIFHIECKQYKFAQAVLDGKSVEYVKVPSAVQGILDSPREGSNYLKPMYEWKWMIKD